MSLDCPFTLQPTKHSESKFRATISHVLSLIHTPSTEVLGQVGRRSPRGRAGNSIDKNSPVLAQDRQRGSVSFSLQESVSLLKKSLLKRLVVPKQVQNAPDTCQT